MRKYLQKAKFEVESSSGKIKTMFFLVLDTHFMIYVKMDGADTSKYSECKKKMLLE